MIFPSLNQEYRYTEDRYTRALLKLMLGKRMFIVIPKIAKPGFHCIDIESLFFIYLN